MPPINKIRSSSRGKAANAGVLALFASGGGYSAFLASKPPVAVVLDVDHLIKPWEGVALKSHWDPFAKIWDICYGETNGITAGRTKTPAECESMLIKRVYRDYYTPLRKCIASFDKKPISVQATAISGAYNFGVGGMCGSTAARFIREGKYREACEAQTAWNRAGLGKDRRIVPGLVNRREMGDA